MYLKFSKNKVSRVPKSFNYTDKKRGNLDFGDQFSLLNQA